MIVMKYEHAIDISEGTMDVLELNRGMSTLSNRVKFAIDGLNSHDDDFRLTLRFLIQSFVTTHESILVILRHKNETKFDKDRDITAVIPYGSDAMSLVREQIEKVFMICLLCDDSAHWSKVYLKDDWRRLYENQLHQRDETTNLERFKEFNEQIAPRCLEQIRLQAGVTALQKEWVEFCYANPNKDIPAHLKGNEIKPFPTAGQALKKLRGKPQEIFLNRLHQEYKFICGYTHSGHLKLQMLMMSDRLFKNEVSDEEKEQYFQKQVLGPATVTSFVSSLAACTEVIDCFLKDNLEVLAAAIEQWNRLKAQSLLAKAIWDMRADSLLSRGLDSGALKASAC
jgi:hypothetical protein